VYFVRTERRIRWLLQGVLPIVGIALLLPTLYYSGHGLTYPASDSLPTLAIWMGLGVLALIGLVLRKHDIGAEARRWMSPEPTAVPVTEHAGS
jgi:hypothetical protein